MHIASSPIVPASAGLGRSTPALSILTVLAEFPVLSETFVSNEIRALRAAGHAVAPLSLRRSTAACQPEDEIFKAETVHLDTLSDRAALLAIARNPAGVARAVSFARGQRGLPTRSLLRAGARVALAARRVGATHIHAHYALATAATAIVAARLAGCTASFIAHGFDVYGAPIDLPEKLRAADLVFATCEDMASDFRRVAPHAAIRVVSCGIDPERFRPPANPARNGRVLAIGRLVEQKGYETLLDALAALPEADRPFVDAVGGGPLLDVLTNKARALGVARWIEFLGPRPSDWIAEHGPHYLGFVAPYVICANGDRDSGPVVAKEALAMRLPVVASALMGLKEIVGEDRGRLVPPSNAIELAKALHWLATLDETERGRLGANGRATTIERFSLRAQADRMGASIAGLRP